MRVRPVNMDGIEGGAMKPGLSPDSTDRTVSSVSEKESSSETSTLLGRVQDALTVAFINGCGCGGKSNPNWRSGHAENCAARYFGPLIEEVEAADSSSVASLQEEVEQLRRVLKHAQIELVHYYNADTGRASLSMTVLGKEIDAALNRLEAKP